jgi:ankyrin repeat protein
MAIPAVPPAEPASPLANVQAGAGRELQAGAARQRQPALSKDPAAELRRAAEIGDIPAIRALLDAQVDIEARDSAGRTSLMLATLHAQAKTVEALLARGADPNAADAQGTTPLQAALSADQPVIVAALRRAGARERTTPPE